MRVVSSSSTTSTHSPSAGMLATPSRALSGMPGSGTYVHFTLA